MLDSLIIGILCFICCSLFKFPYTPLVSVIVGVTNVIPFFGPFLGAIPSIFLILLDSPIQAVYFALFVLALQQLDGNIIGPLILGDKTGLSSLWVIVAILVGGSFFGVPGMFFGVPVFACFYSAASFFLDVRLRHKDLPLDTGFIPQTLPKPTSKRRRRRKICESPCN
ncbi:MAG: AI-2E family transporter [Dysosmobacter sp.]